MSNPQDEPTMEEILASIRKIISEDAPEGAPAEPQAAGLASAPMQQDDVLELTHEVEAAQPPAPQPPPQDFQEPSPRRARRRRRPPSR